MLKNNIKISFLFLLLNTSFILGQQNLPNITLNDAYNQQVKIDEIGKKNVTIVSFWATWCAPCIEELDNLNDLVETDFEEKYFNIIIISIDDNRTLHKVKALVNSHGWNFELLFDSNHVLKKALNINDIPYTLVVKNQKIVNRHLGYHPGYEEELISFVNKLALEK